MSLWLKPLLKSEIVLGFSCPVLASLPLCDITEEDLNQNPQFCKLLDTLAQHVDQTGLTVPLKTELDKVSADTVVTFGQNLQSRVFHLIAFKVFAL